MKSASFFRHLVLATAAVASLTTATATRAGEDSVLNYLEVLRSDLSSGKTQVYARFLNLSEAEANVFWPLYREYEVELDALGDRRLALTRQFVGAHNTGTLGEEMAKDLARDYFKIEQDRIKLLKKYHGRIAKQVSQIRAVQFVQIEKQIAQVIDVAISSDMPLAGSAPARR